MNRIRKGTAGAVIVGVAVLMLIGCGDDSQVPATPDVAARMETHARDAAQQAKEAMENAAAEGSDAAGKALADARDAATDTLPAAGQAGAEDCLELLSEGAFAEAVAACTAALGQDPENEELADALEKARSEAAIAKAPSAEDALGGLR